MNLEAVFLPPIATDLPSKLCVVIDVLRATSTLVSMFEAGAKRVTLAENIPVALSYAATLAARPLLCGERGGVRPDGFDCGNSPREYDPALVEGKELLMCTSNGTRAMELVAAAPVVLAGSLLNGSAVARAALREANTRGLDIALVCSGDFLGTKLAIDDAFCAGYLVTLMQKAAGENVAGTDLRLDESATAAVRLYRSYLAGADFRGNSAAPPRDAILRAFWESHNAAVLRQVGLAEDVDYCAQLDISDRVPRLTVRDGWLELTSDE